MAVGYSVLYEMDVLTNHRFIYGNIIDVETSYLIEANYEAWNIVMSFLCEKKTVEDNAAKVLIKALKGQWIQLYYILTQQTDVNRFTIQFLV